MPGPGSYDSAIHNVGYDSKKFNMQGKTYNPSGKYSNPLILQLTAIEPIV